MTQRTKLGAIIVLVAGVVLGLSVLLLNNPSQIQQTGVQAERTLIAGSSPKATKFAESASFAPSVIQRIVGSTPIKPNEMQLLTMRNSKLLIGLIGQKRKKLANAIEHATQKRSQ